jgi:hypothetical protein
MFIKLTDKATGKPTEVMVRAIVRFSPTQDEQDTIVKLSNGETLAVTESMRSVRGYIRKASRPIDDADEPRMAPNGA